MGREHRRRALTVVACALGLSAAGIVSAGAQLFPVPGQETTTTTAQPSPVPGVTAAPSPGEPAPTPAPLPGEPVPAEPVPGGDGDGTDPGGRAVPPEAQAVIDAIARTPANHSGALVEGVAALVAAGVAEDDAARAVYGRFPIHGMARWVDDWHYPRWTGSLFRFHLGLDMMADFGTPVAAPSDGVARIANGGLGGLTINVVEPDGSYWYLAHLSGIAEGVVDGTPVAVGQIVGFVGDSGNARGGAPHLHLGRYQTGVAVPPKPYVDAFVADGAARVVELLASVGVVRQPTAVVAADLTRRLTDGVTTGPETSGPPRSELLWASAASPTGGAVAVAEATAASLGELVDWDRRGAEQRSADLAWAAAVDRAWAVMGPLMHPTLRLAVEQRRIAPPAPSVAEVGELERDPEVLALQGGDDGL